MTSIIEKVTAFVTRKSVTGYDVVLFRHPHAGIQIPAGTVEAQESPEAAVLREAFEETGLSPLSVRSYLGHTDKDLSEGEAVILKTTPVYARPSLGSINLTSLRNGITVKQLRKAEGFTQVCYEV